ncbi:MAG: heparinase II/III family protein [Desulfobulbaceae bacterium]|nr:heparinase II/III family protein [Desulfobulbaceae bacterium]
MKSNPCLYRNDIPPNLLKKSALQTLHFPVLQGAADDETISRLLGGKVFTLHHDPTALKEFEGKWRGHFCMEVKQGPSDPDIRAVWEPARLQHLMILLQHLADGCDEDSKAKIKGYVRDSLNEWLGKNPFPFGPHYISVMECGLRIPVFIRALLLLDNLVAGERENVLWAIYQHGWLIRKRLSLHSSLGNHTVTECLGLVMAGGLFREGKQGKEWLKAGISLLEQECRRQVLDDGGPAEQSLNYHRFVLDLYWLAIDFLEGNKLHDCGAMRGRLLRGEKFLAAFQARDGVMPDIGDNDGAYAVAPGLSPKRSDLSSFLDEHDIHEFPEAGYTVIRNKSGDLLSFDHGPLGMAPLFNHGHADALSINLFKNGQPIFIDPGTFQYNGSREKRKYFKGTRAHNTVTIDGQDQAFQLTGFIWDKPYNVIYRREERHGLTIYHAMHDGYKRLADPVCHSRKLVEVKRDTFIIIDTFSGEGNHLYELNFHLHPEVLCEKKGDWWQLAKSGSVVKVRLLENEFETVYGQQDPLLGWYSPAYGVVQETTVLQCRKDGAPNDITFTTIICLDPLSETSTDKPVCGESLVRLLSLMSL